MSRAKRHLNISKRYKKHYKKLVKTLEKMSWEKKIFLYLSVFLLTLAIGGFIGGSLKAKKLYLLYTKRKEIREAHQQRVRDILTRFEALASYNNLSSKEENK